VLELEFSLAKILSFLVEYRRSPREAISNVEAWITRIREERKEAKNDI
jgi:chaperone BCS1